jgi:hypothetical protein
LAFFFRKVLYAQSFLRFLSGSSKSQPKSTIGRLDDHETGNWLDHGRLDDHETENRTTRRLLVV